MKNKKHLSKILSLCIAVSVIFTFSGVGNIDSYAFLDFLKPKKSTSTSETTAESTTKAPSSSTEKQEPKNYGTIVSIDSTNKKITIEAYTNGMGGPNQNPGAPAGENAGNPPELPSGDNGQNGGNPPELPQGNPPELPSGDNGQNGSAPPAKPQGGNSQNGGTPPEKPQGGNSQNGGTPPAKPQGNNNANNGETPPAKPDENSNLTQKQTFTYAYTSTTTFADKDNKTLSAGDLKANDFIEYTLKNDSLATVKLSSKESAQSQMGNFGGQPGGGQGQGSSSAPSEYTAVNHWTEDKTLSNLSESSTGTDENITWVSDGATVTYTSLTASKTSSDSTGGDNSSFYGVGAAYLVTDGELNISNSTITTDSKGGAGVFAYGSGVANVSNTKISTTKSTSGGIHVAGGGTLNASNLTIVTNGESSAAIRSDRGSGTMVVNGGTYTSNGTGSPAVYSTADITVSNAKLAANNSEAVCIEGKNSLKLTDCDVTSNMPNNSQNDCKWSVILYQSMSGDSEVGESNFTMTGGSLTSKAGGLFYTTNTSSSFYLEDVELIASSADFLIKCTGNSNARGWGQSGSNGADCTFTTKNQVMSGDVIWDNISTLDLTLGSGTKFTGRIIEDNTNGASSGSGSGNVVIESGATWVVTKDSTVTSLTNKGTIVDSNNKTVTIVDANGNTLVSGTSDIKITVTSYNN